MKRACVLAVALTLAATLPRAAAPAITIDASTSAGKVSPLLYGLMTEESRSRTLYVKLVNPGSAAAPVQFDVTGATLRPTATALTIAGNAQDTNSIDAPERVVPKTSQVTGVKSGFTYTVPANGIVVLTLGMQ